MSWVRFSGDIFMQTGERPRIRLERQHSRVREEALEIENGHTVVRAAVDDERSRAVGFEEVLPLAEDLPV
jgi:hypothetical protein